MVIISFSKLKLKLQNVTDPKTALHAIRNDLPDKTVRKYVLSFRKRLTRRASKLKLDISNIQSIKTYLVFIIIISY